MNTQKTNIMNKRIIFLFLILGTFITQSFAQDRIYVWSGGTATGFNIADVDSISFTAPNAIDYNLTSFDAVAGDVYAYEHDGIPAGFFTVTEVSPDVSGFRVVLNFNGTTSVTLSYTGNSFLTTGIQVLTGAQVGLQTNNLLLYLEGTTKTVKAGQLASFFPNPNDAKITKFAKK